MKELEVVLCIQAVALFFGGAIYSLCALSVKIPKLVSWAVSFHTHSYVKYRE